MRTLKLAVFNLETINYSFRKDTMRKKLSTSVSTFRTIIRENGMYVDKTREIHALISKMEGQFFLARPRRFGKSLTLSTLESVFLGERELFKGLYLYDQPYDWKTYPVIRMAMNKLSGPTCAEVEDNLCMELDWQADRQGLNLAAQRPSAKFRELIQKLTATGAKVVILIDEYDKPILDNILNRGEVLRIRTLLKQFYGMIKAMEEQIRFSFITGVSKFTQVSIFSDLNNLDDMTMMPAYATLCGFTQEECERYFAPWIDENATKLDLSREAYLDRLRRRYNGFRFSREPLQVYNPVSFTKAMDHGDFGHYWFETGTLTFLLELLRQEQEKLPTTRIGWGIPDLDGIKLMSDSFSSYEIEHLKVEALLFQTGYLTIVDHDPKAQLYTLGYPNDEVRFAFIKKLSGYFTPVPEARVPDLLEQLRQALVDEDLNRAFEVLGVFYARVDYSIRLKHEKYYQTIFYILFTLLGYRIRVEVNTNKGRMDAVLQTDQRIYIFEFKLNMSAEQALAQIRNKEYCQKYTLDDRPLTLVGVAFNKETGEIADWQAEEYWVG